MFDESCYRRVTYWWDMVEGEDEGEEEDGGREADLTWRHCGEMGP